MIVGNRQRVAQVRCGATYGSASSTVKKRVTGTNLKIDIWIRQRKTISLLNDAVRLHMLRIDDAQAGLRIDGLLTSTTKFKTV